MCMCIVVVMCMYVILSSIITTITHTDINTEGAPRDAAGPIITIAITMTIIITTPVVLHNINRIKCYQTNTNTNTSVRLPAARGGLA